VGTAAYAVADATRGPVRTPWQAHLPEAKGGCVISWLRGFRLDEVTAHLGSGACEEDGYAWRTGVIDPFIWARLGDQRQRSFVTGYPGRPPGFQDHEDIRGIMHTGRRQRVADGGQMSVPWRHGA
jgi:hypothetical protein